MASCLIGLGSNLGNRAQHLNQAITALRANPNIQITAVSSYHATKAVGGPGNQAEFLNATARGETVLRPEELLAELQHIETQLGRTREVRWSARTLDLDLLLYDSQVIQSDTLEVPHPRMAFRRFVLQPAAEIAADMVHEPTGWTVQQLLARLDSAQNYIAITGGPYAGRAAAASQVAALAGCKLVTDPVGAEFDQYARGKIPLPPARQLAMLKEREIALEATSQEGTEKNQDFLISDFWIGESFALAHVGSRSDESQQIQELWNKIAAIRSPKLTVLLGHVPVTADRTDDDWPEYQEELEVLARSPYQFPLLVLKTNSAQAIAAEVCSAISSAAP